MSVLNGIVLTAPALLLAGLAASPHCGLMCGPLARVAAGSAAGREIWERALLVNLGRILGYALLGGVAGYVGALLSYRLPSATWGDAFRLIAAAAVIAIGIAHLRSRTLPPCMQRARRSTGQNALLGRGMLWSLMPCPMLYGVLALCAMSGTAGSGALLAGAFGVGTAPMMSMVIVGSLRLQDQSWRLVGSSILIGLGVLGALATVLPQDTSWLAWCFTGV
ncbi:sulfite exporter TauE/SafE family protein [Algiphilus sp. NNCM1]|uniref:sulfite exporter TauE/SafE family protein n=1 Tax=Algiphilus sp. TaxID=1872431 RepID=UPI001CA62988|nr:sulfite exporter TauE/SafE family protein [Algiphilus sp.]MBY8965839.1 sulfite exporter TauE/SafE family protein [Algiphilus acroporae]MCI5061361.1 sulfite exporter TauE/SafE family protein [Algiphilus sp.]MCI5102800.1 sulfite exporter TauE/SafE family protein [Algiphilus sp.]